MAIRTTAELVREELGDDYGPKADGTLPPLTSAIRRSNVLVNRIATLAAAGSGITALGDISSDSDALETLETLLAAHFYTAQDKPLQSTSEGGASGSFQGQAGQGLLSTRYGQDAIDLDYSRILAAISKGAFAQMAWAGKAPSDQTPYDQRD